MLPNRESYDPFLWPKLKKAFFVVQLIALFSGFILTGMGIQKPSDSSRKGSQENERRRKSPPNLEYRAASSNAFNPRA